MLASADRHVDVKNGSHGAAVKRMLLRGAPDKDKNAFRPSVILRAYA